MVNEAWFIPFVLGIPTSDERPDRSLSGVVALSDQETKSKLFKLEPSGDDLTESGCKGGNFVPDVKLENVKKSRMKRWIRKKERMLQQAKNEGRSFDQVMQVINLLDTTPFRVVW